MSQRDLATKAGVSKTTVMELEGRKRKPTFQTRRKLAKALKVQPNEIEF